jgi:hypothetical protein
MLEKLYKDKWLRILYNLRARSHLGFWVLTITLTTIFVHGYAWQKVPIKLGVEQYKRFRAILSNETLVHDHYSIEIIEIDEMSISYVYAADYRFSSDCSSIPGKCSTVLWGTSSMIESDVSINRRQNQELLKKLLALNALQLDDRYESQNGITNGWFDLNVERSGKILRKNIVAKGYHISDPKNVFHSVFDFMRSLKRDIGFLSREYNFNACLIELENPRFSASPHWRGVKLATIAYLESNGYKPALPVLQRMLVVEKEAEIKARIAEAIKTLQNTKTNTISGSINRMMKNADFR